MGTRLKFKFTNDDVDELDDSPRQAYPMQRRRFSDAMDYDGHEPVVQYNRREPRATAERYVRRVKIEEVATNDSTVSLNGALRSTFELLQLLFGFGMAGLCMYFLGDAFSFAIKAVVAVVAFCVSILFLKSLRSGDGGNGAQK